MRPFERLLLCSLVVLSLFMAASGCRRADERTVPDAQRQPPPPTISASGELLYATTNGRLALLHLGGSSASVSTVLREGLPVWTSFAWSPDGEAIALALPCLDRYGSPATHDVVVFALESGEMLHEIRGFKTDGIGLIEWPAAGDLFSLDSGTSFASGVDVFRLGRPEPVVSIGVLGGCVWSPDAEMIAYCRYREIEPPNPWEACEVGGSGDLAVYRIRDEHTVTLIEGTREFMYLPGAWLAPDRLLVQRMTSDIEASARFAYFECNLSDPQSLTPVEELPYHLDRDFVVNLVPPALRESCHRTGQYAWNADLSYVAVALEAEIGRFEVWVISADGAEAGRVADDAAGGRSLWRPR